MRADPQSINVRSDRGKRRSAALIIMGGLAATGASLGWTPALADQSISARDNGEVRCDASQKDLTRISLRDDQFVAVSKIESDNPLEAFSIVHEPTRGDLYLSVPDGFARPSVSFFATTRRGFVYKFNCRVSGEEAKQIFIANADTPQATSKSPALSGGLGEQSVALVKAMFEQRAIDGFEIRDQAKTPVNVGALKVQLLTEYLSPALSGKILRIENTGKDPVTLKEEMVSGGDAVAVSLSSAELKPGQATAAYVVLPGGGL